jgi:hypothetical protein
MKLVNAKKLKNTIVVKRKRSSPLPAYSIMTHKSQGQMLPKIIIDLNIPPKMAEVASAYAPLSRTSEEQIAELNRLAAIFEQTKQNYAQYFV